MKPKVSLIGVGMGNPDTLTQEAKRRIESCELLLGAPRLLQSLNCFSAKAKKAVVLPEKIAEEISAFTGDRCAVLLSGDPGFYSGAKNLYPLLKNYEVETIPGISSVAYFCAKLQIPWEDAFLVSAHGRDCKPSSLVMTHEKTIFLTGGKWTAEKICDDLCENGFSHLKMSVGEKLSYPEENILCGTAGELWGKGFEEPNIVLAENDAPTRKEFCGQGLSDDEFIRSPYPPMIPMTKNEVRSVSLSRLHIRDGDVIYDIGAGTGSVSVEAALLCPQGDVYAVEQNERAVELLKENREKFGAWNMKIISGMAPEVLSDLPSPDCVFVGGSKGNLKQIFAAVLAKNPRARIVVNAVALETLSEAVSCLKEFSLEKTEISQLSVARARSVGGYQMMIGQNPVYIISGQGSGI